MKYDFVASGTQDGRGLVEYLLKQNYKVMASVVTNYGKELLPKDENLIINDHKLDEEAMKNCLKENQIKFCRCYAPICGECI